MCILLTTETRAGSLKGPRWRFARAIHIDPPEGHPQPLPLGKSAFKSTLCQPPTPQPSEKVAFKKLFRQCLNLFPRSQQLFSFLPSFLSHFPALAVRCWTHHHPPRSPHHWVTEADQEAPCPEGEPCDRMHCSRSLSCIIFLSALPKSHQPARDAFTFFFLYTE